MSRLLIVIVACIGLNACAATPGGVDAWVQPIYISKDDVLTEGTAKQILIHNETLESLDQN